MSKMSKKSIGIIVFIIYIIITICVISWIVFTVEVNPEAFMTGALFILTPLGIFFYNHIKDEIDSFVNGLYTETQLERILIVGRSESGKSTFITKAFTLPADNNQKSTEYLSIEKHNVKIRIKIRTQKNQYRNHDISVDVLVGDYKGEDPSQIFSEELPDFLGDKKSPLINSIVFIVDLIPAKSDDNDGDKYVDDQALLKYLIDNRITDIIPGRIKKHESYLGDAFLNLIFKMVNSKKLRKVAFVINKIDLIEKLIEDNKITISDFGNAQENFANAQGFAEAQFKEIIENLKRACDGLEIELKIFCISANNADSVRPVILYLLEEHHKRS